MLEFFIEKLALRRFAFVLPSFQPFLPLFQSMLCVAFDLIFLPISYINALFVVFNLASFGFCGWFMFAQLRSADLIISQALMIKCLTLCIPSIIHIKLLDAHTLIYIL